METIMEVFWAAVAVFVAYGVVSLIGGLIFIGLFFLFVWRFMR